MKRILLALAFILVTTPVIAANDIPLVDLSGQIQQEPSGDVLDPSTTVSGALTTNDCIIYSGSTLADGGATNPIGSITSNCNFPTNATVGSVANAGQGIYLGCLFRDSVAPNGGEQALQFFVSEDAVSWNKLTADPNPYTDTTASGAAGRGIRDPSCIQYGGKFWVAHTLAGTNDSTKIGIASSSYLNSGWSNIARPDTVSVTNAFTAWAPEWVHNPDGSPYLFNGLPAIIVTVHTNGATDDGQPYLLTPTDATMATWNAPQAITWPGHKTGGTAAEVSTTATVTISGGHSYIATQKVHVSGCSVSGYNGNVTITSVTATTLVYTAGSGLGAATGCVVDADAIDYYPVVSGGTFYLFGKDDPAGAIFLVTGSSLTNYDTLSSWRTLSTGGSDFYEGTTVIQLSSGTWEMINDHRNSSLVGLGMVYSTATSLTASWSAAVNLTMPAPYYNHGTVIRVMDVSGLRNIIGAFAANASEVHATLNMASCTVANNVGGGEVPFAASACSGSTGTFTKIDDTGGFYNASNNTRLTFPSQGRYQVCAHVEWPSNATGNRIVEIDYTNTYTSSSNVWGEMLDLGSTAGPWRTTCWQITGNKGDYVQMGVFQNSGSGLSTTDVFTITRMQGY